MTYDMYQSLCKLYPAAGIGKLQKEYKNDVAICVVLVKPLYFSFIFRYSISLVMVVTKVKLLMLLDLERGNFLVNSFCFVRRHYSTHLYQF